MSKIRSEDEIEGLRAEELTREERCHYIELTVRALVWGLARKDVSAYPFRDDVYEAIQRGEVTREEIVGWFADALRRLW